MANSLVFFFFKCKMLMNAMERNKTEEGDRECWDNLKSVVRKRRPKERSCGEVSSGGGRSNCEGPEQQHLVF